MPIKNESELAPLSTIKVERDVRQRTVISPLSAAQLALAIGKTHWVSPLLVDEDTNTLAAGERRLTAFNYLQQEYGKNGSDPYLSEDDVSLEIQEQVRELAQNPPPEFAEWTKIPVQYGHDLTARDLMVFEFRENADREDLSWQDKAKAIYDIHQLCLDETAGKWYAVNTSKLLSISESEVSRVIHVENARRSGDNLAQQIVEESTTLKSARQALSRQESRAVGSLNLAISGRAARALKQEAKKTGGRIKILETSPPTEQEKEELEPSSFADKYLMQTDFISWADSYQGPPFNFIHCDFPYGIDFNKSQGQSTSADVRASGTYDDSEEVYWALIESLHKNRDRLISRSAHLMFWYSQNLERETIKALDGIFSRAVLQKFKMIWHCADNSGITPDPQRYGRRTYETALCLTFGDRHIVSPKALSFVSPRENNVHRSQKPRPVLDHFFSMFVDQTSKVLDPTCGSATSVISAHHLNATKIVGIEKDEEMYKKARNHVNRFCK